jgi:hypothetical protein
VPIFDSQAWRAINVIAQLTDKIPIDLTLTKYDVFLQLHTDCFGAFYSAIDQLIGDEFSDIFDAATQNEKASVKEAAKRQYANHITVIDQLLWHLGKEISFGKVKSAAEAAMSS